MEKSKKWADDTRLSDLAKKLAAETRQNWYVVASAVEISIEHDTPMRGVTGRMVVPSALFTEDMEEFDKRQVLLLALLEG